MAKKSVCDTVDKQMWSIPVGWRSTSTRQRNERAIGGGKKLIVKFKGEKNLVGLRLRGTDEAGAKCISTCEWRAKTFP